MAARIIILSGACGTGKTSISRKLAETSKCTRTVHIHTDDFYQFIRQGYKSPWLDGTGIQNQTVITAAAASAEKFSNSGYEVFVDGTIGPWFLEPWLKLAKEGHDIRYIILRPNKSTTLSRAIDRMQRPFFPLHPNNIEEIWDAFSDLEKYEVNVIDTTNHTVDESVSLIQEMLKKGNYKIN